MQQLFLKTIFLIVFQWSFFSIAQLDSIHWVPPLYESDGATATSQYLYLSTPSLIPFVVTISNGGGMVLAAATISKGSPFRYTIGTSLSTVMYVKRNQLNTPQNSKGLIIKGTKKFYANFRCYSTSQAGSLTAKGRGGAGTRFRIGVMPNYVNYSYRNNFASIMATEDGTTVTVSGYNTGVVFDGVPTVGANSLSVTLNAGETYTVGCKFNVAANKTGFIGALVTSDKPIVLNSGNYLGALETVAGGQDILIDQMVPTDVIGDEYISIRANGANSMERVLVIADQNNTDVFVNGNPVPVATLSAGGWYLINSNKYQGVSHKNMYIKASKPVYCLQSLGGSTSPATYGMNLLAPLSCDLLTKIEEISDVNRIGGVVYTGGIFIVTRAGATVQLNGVTQVGGQAILGNPSWVTYRISGLTGNQTITSSANLIGGMFGVNGAMGWAGYFSGFDRAAIPIETSSNTISNDSCGAVILNAPTNYSTYNWFYNGQEDSSVMNQTNITTELSGSYYVAMTNSFGCVDTAFNNHVEVFQRPSASFTYSDTCFGMASEFNNTSIIVDSLGDTITNWLWNFSTGDSFVSQNVTHSFATVGNYSIQLKVTTNMGCTDSVSHSINVHALPSPLFTVQDSCEYDSVIYTDASSISNPEIIASYSWDINNDGIEDYNTQNSAHLFTAGTYITKLTITSGNGCTKDTTMPVLVYPKPQAGFSFTNECLYDTISFVDVSSVDSTDTIIEYSWNFGESLMPIIDTQIISPSYIYSNAGVYNVTEILTTANGCLDTAIHIVEAFVIPTANFYVSDACLSSENTYIDSSSIANGNITTWNWNFGDSAIGTNQEETHIYEQDGVYNVNLVVISDNNCRDTASGNIEVFRSPDVSIVVNGDSAVSSLNAFTFDNILFSFTGDSSSEINWEIGNSYFTQEETFNYMFEESGNYICSLVLTDSINGCTSVDSVRFIVNYNLLIPEAVSPNGDGKNDRFEILVLNEYEGNSLEIYNRWGDIIFTAEPYLNDWFGQNSKTGQIVSQGTYFYILKLINKGKEEKYTGFIELKRE